MKILRVNLSNGEITDDLSYPQCWGRELIAEVLTEEVNPKCHAFSKENKLIITGGPLAGTGVSSCGRLSIGGKSPLTEGIKESNSGGMAANYLARWGIRGIIIEGESENLCTLLIGEKIALTQAEALEGLKTSSVVSKCKEKHGSKACVICIGPAAENKMLASGIAITDMEGRPGRYAARGGLGAVMGSKGLKAIVIQKPSADKKVKIYQEETFKKNRAIFHEAILKNPVTAHSFRDYGTAHVVNLVQELGGLPTRNFSIGRFEHANKISGEALRELILERGGKGKTTHSCMAGCLIMCSNVFPDKNGEIVVSPLEYETLGMMGSNLGIGSLDEIAILNNECNELGLDTIEIGAAIGIAMDEGILSFGDFEGVMHLLQEVYNASYLGRIIGSGAVVTGKVFGSQRVPAAKGQGFPAYDPRAIKGFGVTYASSPMGADHTAGYTLFANVNHHSPEKQLPVSREIQIIRATIDSWGVCSFSSAPLRENWQAMIAMINAVQNTDYAVTDVDLKGRKVIKMERAFNQAAGIMMTDAIPDFMRKEHLPPFNLTFDVESDKINDLFNGN